MRIIKEYLQLYNNGMTVTEITTKLGKKYNTVVKGLHYAGKSNMSKGMAIEKDVCNWFEQNGYEVKHMRGDCKYDLLLNNTYKVDIKSASYSKRDKRNIFSLQTHINHPRMKQWGIGVKDLQKEVDKFLLVFMGLDRTPMYFIDSDKINVKYGLSINLHGKSKYLNDLEFLGFLDSEVKKINAN